MSVKRAPKPGQPVRGSRTGRPIMALLDLLGQRWTLRIVWELRERNMGFRELRAACSDVSPTILNKRLHELREAGFVDAEAEGYYLSPYGLELIAAMKPLVDIADAWKKRA